MAFALRPGKSIRRELRRIARKELGRAADRLPQDRDEDVHEGRKGVKKVEAIARLLDQIDTAPPRRDLKRLRAARRSLSKLRDGTVAIETFDRLRSRFARHVPEHTVALIKGHLSRRKSAITRRAQANAGSLARAVRLLKKIRRAAKKWPAASIDVSALPQLLSQSFRASRKAMQRAQRRGRPSDFHTWRKQVKNLWYQLRLSERLVSGLGKQIVEFEELETALGEEHNLVVLRNHLTRTRSLRRMHPAIERLDAMSIALRDELRRAALVLGARLYERSPKEFAKDLRKRLRPNGTPRRRPSAHTRGQAVA